MTLPDRSHARPPRRTPRPSGLPSLVLAVCLALVGGCAGLGGGRDADVVAAEQGRLVARDFVAALERLRGYDPRTTTVQMRSARTAFGEALGEELRRAGYGMQLVADDEDGPLLVSYEAEAFEDDAGRSVGYRLRVGAIELGREYELRAGRVFPMTALSVRGVPIGREPLDDTLFDRNRRALEATGPDPADPDLAKRDVAGASTGRSTGRAGGVEPASPSVPSVTPLVPAVSVGDGWQPLSPNTERRVAARAREVGPATEPGLRPVADEDRIARTPFGHRVRRTLAARDDANGTPGPSASAPVIGGLPDGGPAPEATTGSDRPTVADRARRNVMELGRSNFAPLLDGYDVAEEHVLAFPDDSLRLGEDNKALLRALAARFDPATDLISVLGCSHGPTGVEGGNALLATGRAHRTKEALVRAGIEPGAVLDEGCWAPTAQPDRPSRAVVVARRTRRAGAERS